MKQPLTHSLPAKVAGLFLMVLLFLLAALSGAGVFGGLYFGIYDEGATAYYDTDQCHSEILSDLHNADPAPVVSSLRTHAPSLICITGDVLYGGRPEDDTSPVASQANVLPFLRSCASIAPTFLSLGNHEWMVDA